MCYILSDHKSLILIWIIQMEHTLEGLDNVWEGAGTQAIKGRFFNTNQQFMMQKMLSWHQYKLKSHTDLLSGICFYWLFFLEFPHNTLCLLPYNWWQNQSRHFALKGLSEVLLTSKGENKTFPPPSPPCNVVLLFKLRTENNKHPNFELCSGEGCAFFFSLKLPYLNTMSQQFYHRLRLWV